MAKKGSRSSGSGLKAGGIFVDIRMGIANLQKDTREATRTLKSLEKDITGITKNISTAFKLAGAVTGIYAATKSVQSLGAAIGQLASKGDAASDVADNFRALGGSSQAIEDARKALLGTVGAVDLMKVGSEGLLRGIPGLNQQFGKLADFSKRYAETTDQDTLPVLENFISALAKGQKKGLEPFGFALAKNGTTAQNQAAVFQQLQARIDSLVKPTDSVAEAQDALSQSADLVLTKFSQGVNSSDSLTLAYRSLIAQLDKTDLTDLGKQFGDIFSLFINLANVAIPPLLAQVKNLANRFEYLFQTSDRAKAAKLQDEVNSLNQQLADSGRSKDMPVGSYYRDRYDEILSSRNAAQAQHDAIIEKLKQQKQEEFQIEKDSAEKTAKAKREIEAARTEAELKAGKEAAAKKAQAAVDALQKEISKFDTDTLKDKLESAIDFGNQENFSAALNDYKKQVYNSVVDAHKEAYSQGGAIAKQVEDLATQTADAQAQEYTEKFDKAIAKTADELRDKHIEAYKTSIQNWESLFDIAINGAGLDLEAMLKDAAVGFAAQMAQATLGSITGFGISNPRALGSSLASSILGESLGGGSLLETLGIGGVGGLLGSIGGGAGVMLADGSIVAAGSSAAAGGVASAAMPGSGLLGAIGPALPYVAVAAVAAGVIHKNWGSIEKFFGGGSQNAETNARQDYAGKLEDLIKEMGGLSLYKNGKLERLTDIKVGANDRFNDPGWADSFNSMDPSTKGVFNALGQGLKGILGITEDVGGQMAMILSENFGGSVDNARTAVQQLGLSFGDFEKYFLELAEKGTIRWSEFNVQIAGISEAFKPGLVAVGATKQAFDQLVASGGKGINAVIQAKNVAQEGLDLGIQTIQQLGEKLKADGANPEQVAALVQSAAERGMSALKDIAGGTNQQVGSIVGGMEALSGSLQKTWEDMFKNIDELNNKFANFPSEVVTTFKIGAEIDPQLSKLMDTSGMTGGSIPTIDSGSLSLASNSGTEALRTSRISKRSVSIPTANTKNVNVNVDARGDSVDVERRVIAAVRRVKNEIIGETVEKVSSYSKRGMF